MSCNLLMVPFSLRVKLIFSMYLKSHLSLMVYIWGNTNTSDYKFVLLSESLLINTSCPQYCSHTLNTLRSQTPDPRHNVCDLRHLATHKNISVSRQICVVSCQSLLQLVQCKVSVDGLRLCLDLPKHTINNEFECGAHVDRWFCFVCFFVLAYLWL